MYTMASRITQQSIFPRTAYALRNAASRGMMAVSAKHAPAETVTRTESIGDAMNTKRKTVHVIQCDHCPHTFLIVGTTKIGMAYPRRIHNRYNEIRGVMEPMTGTCPDHRRNLELE